MTPPLLVENENKRLDLPLPMLACIAMFVVWDTFQARRSEPANALNVEICNAPLIVFPLFAKKPAL